MKLLSLTILSLFIGLSSFAEKRKAVSPKLKGEIIKVFSVNEQLHKAFFDYEKQKGNIPGIATKLSQAIDGISDAEIKKVIKVFSG